MSGVEIIGRALVLGCAVAVFIAPIRLLWLLMFSNPPRSTKAEVAWLHLDTAKPTTPPPPKPKR